MALLLSFLLTLILVGASCWGLFKLASLESENSHLIKLWTQEAVEAFKQCRLACKDPRFHLDGATAEIVKLESSGGRTENGFSQHCLTVVVFARNEAGEYFMFRRTGVDRPLIKHVQHGVARMVLKRRYKPPPVEPSGEST